MAVKERIVWIDFAKGFTIFLVVFGHINSGFLRSPNFVEHKSLLVFLWDFISTIRMPLFFMVSGFLYYSKRIDSSKKLGKSILQKLINLGIPYFIFSILFWALKMLISDSVNYSLTWNDLYWLPIKPIEYFWFLYVLFFIFAITEVLDFCFKNKTIVFVIILAVTIIAWNYKIDNLVIRKILSMTIYFYIGKMLHTQVDILKNNRFVCLCLFFYLVMTCFQLVFQIEYQGFHFVVSVAGVFVLLSIAMRLNPQRKIVRYFASAGLITMPIYVLHPPIGASVRMLLLKLGTDNLVLHFVAGVLITWLFSILVYRQASKSRYIDFLFYPGKYLKIK